MKTLKKPKETKQHPIWSDQPPQQTSDRSIQVYLVFWLDLRCTTSCSLFKISRLCTRSWLVINLLQTYKSPDPLEGHHTTPKVFFFYLRKIMIFAIFHPFFHGFCGIPLGTHVVNLFQSLTVCTPVSTSHPLELWQYPFSEVEVGDT